MRGRLRGARLLTYCIKKRAPAEANAPGAIKGGIMAAPQRSLGRGLDTLFRGPQAATQGKESDTVRISIDSLSPNPNQPRKVFTEGALEDLAASIKSQGVLQPLLVRPVAGSLPARYEIVAGERRWRASKLAGLNVVPVVVRDLTDQEALAAALIENLQRENLNPMEEAFALRDLREQFGLTQEDLAVKIGKSRPAIANTLRLLQLPEAVQEDVRQGHMTAGHARALLVITEEDAQDTLRRHILSGALSVREAEAAAMHWRDHGALPEQFAGALPPPVAAPRARQAKNPPADAVMALQTRLAAYFALKVKVRGTEEKGRIILSYGSPEELAALLQRLPSSLAPDTESDMELNMEPDAEAAPAARPDSETR